MTKKQWLEQRVMCDEWGRPPSLADVPLTIMTRKEALLKQGGDKKSINELWEKTKKIFRVFDTNNDGFIIREEMERLVKNMYAFIKHDNPDVAAESTIEEFTFAEMDEDSDGKVTEAEFMAAVERKAEFTSLLTDEVDKLLLI